MLGHEIHSALARTDHGLPCLHWQILWARYQSDLFQCVSPVRDFRRYGVVLALMREGLLVESLHHDLDLFFKHFTVGVVVGVSTRHAKGIHLTGMVSAPDAEDHPSVGQDISCGVVLRQPERVPHRVDVKAAAELELFGDVGQMNI